MNAPLTRRRKRRYVPEQPHVFHSTLREHISFKHWRDVTQFILIWVGMFGAWVWFWYEAFKEPVQ